MRTLIFMAFLMCPFASFANSECRFLWKQEGTALNPLAPPDGKAQRIMFHTSFDLSSSQLDAGEMWDVAVFQIREWLESSRVLTEPEREALKELFDGKALNQDLHASSSEKRIVIRSSRHRHGSGRPSTWALLYEHPDQDLERTYWLAQLSLQFTDVNSLHVTMTVRQWTEESEDEPAHITYKPSCPQLISKLLKHPKLLMASGPLEIGLHPIYLEQPRIQSFFKMLNDPKRVLPVVFISRQQNGLLLVDEKEISRKLWGQAVVYVEPVSGMRLPQWSFKFPTFDGAIRIFRPGAHLKGKPSNERYHRLIPAQTLIESSPCEPAVAKQAFRVSFHDIENDISKWVERFWRVESAE